MTRPGVSGKGVPDTTEFNNHTPPLFPICVYPRSSAVSKESTLSPHCRDFSGQHWDYLQTVADEAEVRHLEDRRVGVFVDRDDRIG